MAHVYKHERGITLTLLGSLGVLLVFVMVWLFLGGLADTLTRVLFAMAALLLVLLSSLSWICMKKQITLDPEGGVAILEYVRYPTHFFDVFPKRRVEVPLDKVACVRPGLLRSRGGIQLSWHVYTTDSRFDFTVYMKRERDLREQLQAICLANQISDRECRLLRSGMSFNKALLIAVGSVFFCAMVYAAAIMFF